MPSGIGRLGHQVVHLGFNDHNVALSIFVDDDVITSVLRSEILSVNADSHFVRRPWGPQYSVDRSSRVNQSDIIFVIGRRLTVSDKVFANKPETAEVYRVSQQFFGFFKKYHEGGITPLQLLARTIADSARLLNLQDAIGKVAVGYRADLIAVAGRPDVRLEDLEKVRWVLIDGVEQRLDGPRWFERPLLALAIFWSRLGG